MNSVHKGTVTALVFFAVFAAGFFLASSLSWAAPTCRTADYIGQGFKGGRISSGFGTRPAPVDSRTGARGSTFHKAIDWVPSNISNVGALYGGTVTFSGAKSGWGNTVVIRQGNFEVQYAHAGNVNVTQGQTISAGQNLGNWASCSGTCTGPHVDLIYRVYINGQPHNVDPVIAENLIAQGLQPGSPEFNQRALAETASRCNTARGSLTARVSVTTTTTLMCDPAIEADIQKVVDSNVNKRVDMFQTYYPPPQAPTTVTNPSCFSAELQRISNQFGTAPSMYAGDILGQVSGFLGPVSGIANNIFGSIFTSFQNAGNFNPLGQAMNSLAQTSLNSAMSYISSLTGIPADSIMLNGMCGMLVDTMLNFVQCQNPIQLPELGNIEGSLNDLIPDNCAGDAIRSTLYSLEKETEGLSSNQPLLVPSGGFFETVDITDPQTGRVVGKKQVMKPVELGVSPTHQAYTPDENY